MLSGLMDKLEGMQRQMNTVNRQIDILRNNPKELLEIKQQQHRN